MTDAPLIAHIALTLNENGRIIDISASELSVISQKPDGSVKYEALVTLSGFSLMSGRCVLTKMPKKTFTLEKSPVITSERKLTNVESAELSAAIGSCVHDLYDQVKERAAQVASSEG